MRGVTAWKSASASKPAGALKISERGWGLWALDYLAEGEFGTEAWLETKYRGLFVLLLALPEFQVH